MRLAELIGALVLGAFSAYLMFKAGQPGFEGEAWFSTIYFTPGEGMGSGTWPFWLSLVMLLSCVWIVVNWVRRASPSSRSTEPFLDAYGLKMLLLVGGGVIAFVWLSTIISMYFAMILFLIYYLRFLGRHQWRLTMTVALAMPIILFLFFDVAMSLPLPKGLRAVEDFIFVPIYDIIY